jgi:peptidoglycan/xylan/chitin deacetylase (PgdA/CDA1 family)
MVLLLLMGGSFVHKRIRLVGFFGLLATSLLVSSSVAQAAPAYGKGRAYYESRGDVVWDVPSDDKLVALTFDDGPDPDDTPRILDLLKQYDAKATFFTIGNKVLRYPELARREAAEGHELANHTYTHPLLGSRSSNSQISREISDTQRAILSVTGRNARLFRPPGGVFNGKVLEVSKKNNLQMVLWSWHQDTRDWARPGVNRIVQRMLRNTRNGDIILMHDYVDGSSQTVDALIRVLPEFQRRGYRMVTVSELLKHGKPLGKPAHK